MNRPSNVLALVLALQLLAVAAAFWPRGNEAERTARGALVELEGMDITRVSVSDGDAELVLVREGERWAMPEYHSLPADPSRLDRVLTDLPALSRGWPVAGSAGAAARFEVAEDDFQRRIEYLGDGGGATVYLGVSPGFRKVHARVDGDASIHSVEFNVFDAPVNPADWLDKTLLRIEDATAVEGLDYSLRKEGEDWLGAGDETPRRTEVDKLTNGLGGLRVTSAADPATAAILEEMQAPPTLSVETAGGTFDFRFYEIEDAHYVQRADIPVFFSLGAFDHDRLTEVTAETLYPAEDETEGEGEEGRD